MKEKRKKRKRQTEADRRPNAHACIHVYKCMYVFVREREREREEERDDDCHISDNVVRCSYNSRISLSLDMLIEMSGKKTLVIGWKMYENITRLTFEIHFKTTI